MKRAQLPTATEMGSVEQYIVANAMSYTAARERAIREPDLEKWVPLGNLEMEFRDELFKHCRRLRKMLKLLASAHARRMKRMKKRGKR